ncbi:MAG: hypothetical protein A2W98_04780 [Bacteroidetes bacterium GWF2_33_38]|nr:MAG: hypothetical protein A2W98_04780 [Bacteroidetes bacterium GWF2_33_38]
MVKKTIEPEIVEEEIEPEFQAAFDSAILPKPHVQIISDVQESKPEVVETTQNYKPITPPIAKSQYKEPKSNFFSLKNYPDLEKFIGENLINKIGIIILVLGLSFFVKYAIDNNWINELSRVAIGVACGGLLIFLAHRMRKSYKAFSSVLVGGGLAILYFTFAVAFQEYQLLSQTMTFAVMVLITLFAVLMSLGYNRQELAILAMIGGFGTPFFVSTGEGNYIVLFSYILILNSGMLILSYFKKWYIVNLVSYGFTIILFGGWLAVQLVDGTVPYRGALFFATMFYLIFFAMNIINNIKEKTKFHWGEISILLSNSFFYYISGMLILKEFHDARFQGVFTASIAMLNFIFAFALYKNVSIDKNLKYYLIGLVLTFLSLSAPVQLEGSYITIFWAVEALLLLWLAHKTEIKILKFAAPIVTVLMLFSLFIDWRNIYINYYEITGYTDDFKEIIKYNFQSVIFNKGFITGIIVIAALFAKIILAGKKRKEDFIWGMNFQYYEFALTGLFILISYFVFYFELSHQLIQYIQMKPPRTIIIASYNLGFVALAMIWAKSIKEKTIVREVAAFFGFIMIVAYLFYYQSEVVNVRNAALLNYKGVSMFHFSFQYLLTILLIVVSILYSNFVKNIFGQTSTFNKINNWFVVVVYIFVLSFQMNHHYLMFANDGVSSIREIISQSNRTGLPILWGLISFVLMLIGMKKKIQEYRIMSLTLFFVTILKLFIFDLTNISEGGKIVAFIILGVLLLIVSFMYQKLKKIIIDGEIEEEKSKNA